MVLLARATIKTLDEIDYPYAVIDSIIYFSTADGDGRLPTSVDAVYRELCDATVEYITGRKTRYQPQKVTILSRKGNKVHWVPQLGFEQEMFDYLQRNLQQQGHMLQPRVRRGIETMLEPRLMISEHNDKGYDYHLRDHFNEDLVGIITRPTNLQLETEQWVKQEIMPALPTPERKDVETIGKMMREYILYDELCW